MPDPTPDPIPPAVRPWEIAENVQCVVCPGCGFTFDADHTELEDQGHSCPNCMGAADQRYSLDDVRYATRRWRLANQRMAAEIATLLDTIEALTEQRRRMTDDPSVKEAHRHCDSDPIERWVEAMQGDYEERGRRLEMLTEALRGSEDARLLTEQGRAAAEARATGLRRALRELLAAIEKDVIIPEVGCEILMAAITGANALIDDLARPYAPCRRPTTKRGNG